METGNRTLVRGADAREWGVPHHLPHLVASRYVLPLREGGSLPAIVDTKATASSCSSSAAPARGRRRWWRRLLPAGSLIALGLPVPPIAAIRLDEGFGRSEPDAEIQDLLRASIGMNFGIGYLAGALGFDVAAERFRPPLPPTSSGSTR